MDILELIKNRRTIRKYQDKPIPKEILDKIIEAGIWGPSVMGMQPWRFVVIRDRKIIGKICEGILEYTKELGVIGRFVLSSAMNALSTAQTYVVVYNSCIFSKTIKRSSDEYVEIARLAEIEAIAAAMQNMLLMAEELKIASCWLDAPVYCEKVVNAILKKEDKLIAILTFGYSAEHGGRSKRTYHLECVEYL